MTTKFWAIEPSILAKYRKFKKAIVISASEVQQFQTELERRRSSELVIVDGVAVIEIRGVLSERPSFYSWLFDGSFSSYTDIIEQLNTAEADPQVEKAQFRVSSGGGRLDGLFKLLYRARNFSKPLEAIVGARADSAAYGIVSQADKIFAENEMSEVGSVGVGVSIWVDEEIVDITSSDSPNKWPDVTKAAGVDVVRSELDEIHAKFAAIIAEGRAAATSKNISLETVNANFGQGGTMLAESGLAADMLDEIIPAPERQSNADFFVASQTNLPVVNSQPKSIIVKRPKASAKPESKTSINMDLNQFKTEHPGVYAQAVAEAQTEAQKTEQKRCQALLKMGKAFNKMDYAMEQIEAGTSVHDGVVLAEFMTALGNKQDSDNRADDNPPPLDPLPEKTDKEEEKAEVASFVEQAKQKYGVK